MIRVWMVENGVRVVHRVEETEGNVVVMACGVLGMVCSPNVRRRHHPFVVSTTKDLTCVTCIGLEEPEDL